MEHKLIEGGAEYLPLAKSRIRAMRATGMKHASQTLTVNGATIRVRIDGDEDYIYLKGGGNYYQFFTTGAEAQHEPFPLALAPYAEMRKGYIVRVGESPKDTDTTVVTTPQGSSVEASPEKDWTFYPSATDLGRKLKTGFQIQAFQHTVHHRSNGLGGKQSKRATLSSWGTSVPTHSLTMRGGLGPVYSALSSPITDLLFDTAPKAGSQQAPDSDWYRQAATQNVESEKYGSRRFVIMVDVANTFYAYPIGVQDAAVVPNPDYVAQAIKTNVADKFARREPAPLPTWAAKAEASSRDYFRDGAKTLRHYYGLVPQYKWSFNSPGTKACAVIYERLNGATHIVDGEVKPLKFTMPGTTDVYPLQEALPGLVELKFTITLTGKKPEDFTFGIEVIRELQPTVDKRYIMAADYAWDIEGKTKLDDLIIMVGRIYHTKKTRQSAGKAYRPLNQRSTCEVYNLTTSSTIRTFLMADTNGLYEVDAVTLVDLPPTAKRKQATCTILAMDLRALAFVLQQKYWEFETVWASATVTSDVAGARQAQRIKVYMRDALVDERVMEPEGSALDAALVAAFDNTAPGAELWSVTEVGTWESTAPTSAYASMSVLTLFNNFAGTTYNTIRQQTLPVIQKFTFDAGAYLYALCLAPLVRYDPLNTFVVHPNKSWALSMRPIFYYAGPAADKDLAGVDLSLFRQTLLDYISFRNSADKEIKTTHREQFNKAYKKSVAEADHLYTFSKAQSANASKKYIKAATPAGGILYLPISNNGDSQPLKLHEFDANYPNFGVIVAKSPSEPFRAGMPTVLDTYYSFRAPGDSWAMTGGSALFY